MIFNGIKGNADEISKLIKKGCVGVIPTDTLYGFSCSALDKNAVERIYKIKGRDESKPFIILISSLEDLSKFNIQLDLNTKEFLENIWPNKISVILSCDEDALNYLHRGTKKIAFRLPKRSDLIELLKRTGPLISTSVNIHGQPAMTDITEIKTAFEDKTDFIVDEGNLVSEPTTLIKLTSEGAEVLRQGEFIVPEGVLK